ncbi:MAG: acyl-phosphate glycerol 3-phosphate acyltransferase [Clostridium sp. SCN 57-10]|nr:MAG: acyl-phosphate glycerol 3-phosphate acyltransferase [Clostridium sp. SCN 57-10]
MDGKTYAIWALCAVLGYLLGSLNGAIIISRLIYRSDIRKHGSGNAGTTNMVRTYGWKRAVLVIAIDMLKVLAAGLLAQAAAGRVGLLIGAAAAVVGHAYPVFFHFKGGKGVLSGAMLVLLIDVRAFVAVIAVFAIVLLVGRYVSLASMVAALSFPFAFAFWGARGPTEIVYASALALLIIYLHRENIKRLISGTEHRISFGRSKQNGGKS